MSFSATFFDGEDLRGHPVVVEILPDGSLEIRGESGSRTIPARKFRFTPSLGRIPRFGHLPDGITLEVPWTTESEEEIACLSPNPGLSTTIVRGCETRTVRTTVAVVLAVAAVMFGAVTAIPRLARRIAFAVPASIEVEIGTTSAAALARYSNQPVFDWSSEERVQNQLDRLTRVRPLHVHPHLLFFAMGQPNAFSLPGGPIVVSEELMRLGLTDNEIAAVLAHELGHEELRHGLQNILTQSTALIVVSMVTGDLSALTHFSGALPALLLTRGYSRDFERQADAFAVGLLAEAHIDPESLAQALEKIQRAGGTAHALPGAYLSTHPSTPERIRLIRALGDKAFGPERLRLKAEGLSLLAAAYDSYHRKDFRSAVDQFRSAFELAPPDDVAHYNAACAAALAGYPKTSVAWLSSAIMNGRANVAIFPTDPALTSLKSEDDWNWLVRTGNDLKRPFAAAYQQRGEAELARGESTAAILDFHRRFAVESKALSSIYLQGTTDEKNGRFAAAVSDFSRANILNPNDLLMYKCRGIAQLYVDPAAGVSDFEHCLSRFPNDAESYFFRGRLRFQSGDPTAAIKDYDRAAALNLHEAYLYYSRGEAKAVRGDFAGARADLQTAVQLYPKDSDSAVYAHFWISLIIRRLNEGEGKADLAAAIGPKTGAWTRQVGLFLSGATTESEFLKQAALGDAKTSSEHECEANYYAGELRLLGHDPIGARDLFRKCVATRVTYFSELDLAKGELARLPAR